MVLTSPVTGPLLPSKLIETIDVMAISTAIEAMIIDFLVT
jgi:hypothetical protein